VIVAHRRPPSPRLLVSAGLVVSTRSRRGAALEGRGAPQPGTLPSTASTISAQAEPSLLPGSKPSGSPGECGTGSGAPGVCCGYFDQVRGRKGIDDATFESSRKRSSSPTSVSRRRREFSGILRDKLHSGALSATDPTALLQALQDDLVAMFDGDVGSLAYGDGDAADGVAVRRRERGRQDHDDRKARPARDRVRPERGAGRRGHVSSLLPVSSWNPGPSAPGARIVRGSDGADPPRSYSTPFSTRLGRVRSSAGRHAGRCTPR